MREQLVQLDIGVLQESASNPRKTFDDEGLEELAESIRAQGILVPLIVRSLNGRYEILSGARRYRATKTVGLKLIPCVLRSADAQKTFEQQIHIAIHEEKLHPLDEVAAYQELLACWGCSQEQFAKRIGKPRGVISARLTLLALHPAAREAYKAGQIKYSQALDIAKLPYAEQCSILKQAVGGTATRAEIHEISREIRTASQPAHAVRRNVGAPPEVKELRSLLARETYTENELAVIKECVDALTKITSATRAA